MNQPLISKPTQKTSASGAPNPVVPRRETFGAHTHFGVPSHPMDPANRLSPRPRPRMSETDRAKRVESQGAEVDTLHHGNRRETTEPQSGSVQQRCN